MSDIIDRLRYTGGFDPRAELCSEAADEIHRLRSAIWVYLARDEENPSLPKYSRVKANEIAHEIITGGRQGFARRAALNEESDAF